MGGNGSGKTTLFNLVTGFLRTGKGEILFNNKAISNQPSYKINRLGIGRTFQDLRLVTKLTVKENIILAMKNNPTDLWVKGLLPPSIFKNDIFRLESKAEQIIEEYYLSDVKTSLAGEISYGQQKLLNLACCIANDASLLLLDEPVAGINPEYRKRMIILLKKLKEQGKTILLIEHNTEFIEGVSDKIFFLSDGKLTGYNSIEELRNDSIVMKAYF